MDNSFFEALSTLGSEANVDTDLLVEKVKSAMLKAARKAYPDSEEIFGWKSIQQPRHLKCI
jgi:N utilization substance protein A